MKSKLTALFCLTFVAGVWAKPLPTELFLRGYSVIPTPRKVQLQDGDIPFDGAWAYRVEKLDPNHIAVRALVRDLQEFHAIALKPAGTQAQSVIHLAVMPGAVRTGADPEVERQGYLLKIAPGRIEIIGNGDPGLFYGAQTLLQLLRPSPRGHPVLPAGTIEDWPRFPLRFLHWDTKHHQDRIETLKRYLDWSARFKVNMIGFELEDKFEYPSHPVIGAPGAFTTAQLQEVVNYGLERYIQVVPQVQAPAHMAYVLKHPEFADLRADGNNYQICLCDERAYQLIFAMYDDVIGATHGVDYFFVSTDEVYYAGLGARCAKPYNPENRSFQWTEFVQRAHQFLTGRGRKMLAWLEYPLLPQHVRRLPPDIINGVLGEDADLIQAQNGRGIRQLAYTSMQGSEYLFPNHFTFDDGRGLSRGRLELAYETIAGKAGRGNPIGVYGAAWDDAGLHSEMFWLGWATVAQYGWTAGVPTVEQTVAEFMNIYYGPRVSEMVEVYRGLQAQARFFERSWDRVVSRARGPGYGNSYGKGVGTMRFDQTLPAPALPTGPALAFTPVYLGRYEKLADEARRLVLENDALIDRLQQNIPKADRNRYNLEVLLSIAEFTGHHDRMILGLRRMEDQLSAARAAAARGDRKQAVGQLVAAHEQGRSLVEERYKTFQYLKTVWEKSRSPKGREVGGKKFYHRLDDTKDHWADRRADLSYLIAPEESIELEKWMKGLAAVVAEYAKQNNVPVRVLEQPRLEQ